MHKNTKDIKGQRFGKLKAIEKAENIGSRVAWLFECDCGNKKSIISTNVVSGKTSSCGCARGSHNLSGIPEYLVWYSMVSRCTNENHKFWFRYGGRGIKVCDRWLSLNCFLEDMGRRPSRKHQLDRIDNNKGYYKDNCRWVFSLDNVRNRHDSKRWFFNGAWYESMRHAAKENGVAHSTVRKWCNNKLNGCYSEKKYGKE